MNEKIINEKGDEENQEEYNDEFNFKESDLNKKENEENKEILKDDKKKNKNKLKESIANNEDENYDNEDFIKDNEELDKKEKEKEEKEKEENDDKKEKEYIDENDNGNDNYENNVSDFLEKDNVHLGPLIDNKEDKKEEVKKEEEKKEDKKEEEKKEDKKEEEKKEDKKEEEKKEEKKKEEEKKEEEKKEEKKEDNIEDKKEEKKDDNIKEEKKEEKKEEEKKDDNINEDKKEEKKDEKEENKNKKKVKYIMNKKESSSNSNSELMSETEILKMSINEDNKPSKEENKEKKEQSKNNIQENKENDNKNAIQNKKEEEEKKEEDKKENKEKEVEDNKEEEKKEEDNEDKKEEIKEGKKKEEENKFSRKGSESLIEDIILNELDDMPKEEIIVKSDNNKKTKIREKTKIEIKKDDKKYKTLKDLEKQPFKRVKIDSPRSLKIIKENGCVLEELYHITLDTFLNTHKETINMNKKEQKIRYNFYERLRLNQIKKLSEIRDKLVKDEELKNKEDNKLLENNNAIYHFNRSKEIDIIKKYENVKLSKINDDNRNINSSKYRTVHSTLNDMEKIKNNDNDKDLVKKIILENEERIIDNKLDIIKAVNDKELANVVEFELDKNLFKLELEKQTENYLNELKQLKYENSKIDKNANLPNSGNAKPVVNKLTTFHENLISFNIAKKKKEYDIFQQKLDQKLEKIEMANKRKNEELQKKKKKEYERATFNLKRSEDIFNKKQNELVKKMQIKDLITNGIKKMNNDIYLDKKENNMQIFLCKQDYIKKLKRKDEYELEQKYKNYIERESKRGKINNIKSRIYSSRVYRMNDLKNKRKKDIQKIQRILKNGEGEDEVNLDILMEEFPDNQKMAEIIEKYQIKKNNIENNLRPRLYSSNNFNIDNNYIYSSIYNKYGKISKSSDRKRIFIYADNNNKGANVNKKNEDIKKEERRINNASNMSNINNNNQNESIRNMYANIHNEMMRKIKAFKEKYPDYELSEDEDIWDEDEDIAYEHEIDERVRNFKVKIYKNFLSKLKREKRNELLRNKQLEIISDIVLRRNLEIQFSKERSLVDARLKKEGERIQKQANEYENSLRRNFQRKQQRFMNQIKDSKK